MTLSIELSVHVILWFVWAHGTLSVSGFAAGGPNMNLYMMYLTKIL